MLSPFSSFVWVVLVSFACTVARGVPERGRLAEKKRLFFYLADFSS